MDKFKNILWGIVILVIGIIWGLNALGITNITIFFEGWWTFLIIIPSLISLITKESKIWSGIFLVIGIVLFLCTRGIISFTLISKLIIPFILIVIGLSLIFKNTIDKRLKERIEAIKKDNEKIEEYCVTFGTENISYQNQEFKGAKVDSIFGSILFDLKNATITKDQIINVNAIFGGVDIIVPKNVNIKVKSTPIFGGTSNKVKTVFNENLPTIYINSVTMFGGVDIK